MCVEDIVSTNSPEMLRSLNDTFSSSDYDGQAVWKSAIKVSNLWGLRKVRKIAVEKLDISSSPVSLRTHDVQNEV